MQDFWRIASFPSFCEPLHCAVCIAHTMTQDIHIILPRPATGTMSSNRNYVKA